MLLHDHLDFAASRAPGDEFAFQDGATMSFGEAEAIVRRIASALANDFEPGDRVGMVARNRFEVALFCFACSRARVVPVLLNPRLSVAEWRFILEDAEAKGLVAAEECLEAAGGLPEHLPELRRAVALDAAAPPGWTDWEDWLRAAPAATHLPRARSEDVALQLYTSGTTGRPKGVLHSHASLFAAAYHWKLYYPLGTGERQLLVMPMHHVGGFLYVVYAAASGAGLYLMRDFDAAALPRVLDEERIGRASFVPAMIRQILDVPGVDERRYADLRFVTYGASAIDPGTLRRALEVFDCEFGQCFGMTEAPNLTYLTADDHRAGADADPVRLLTVGRPGPACEIRIVDPEGHELPTGSVGEIVGRGPTLMAGYWKRPDEEADALREGWMHTGDAGRLDEDGYLTVVDRIKDVIVSGGENVASREVELALLEEDEVADVAVIGVPSERWGETVMAVIVPREGTAPDADALREACRARLAGFKLPRVIEFVESLPRNVSGKLLKRELRERYQDAAR